MAIRQKKLEGFMNKTGRNGNKAAQQILWRFFDDLLLQTFFIVKKYYNYNILVKT